MECLDRNSRNYGSYFIAGVRDRNSKWVSRMWSEKGKRGALSGGIIFWDPNRREGRGNRVVKVSDRGWSCHELEPSTPKDPPCREEMHVKSVESSNILPLVWCGS
ncbi:hypothetical protein TNCV_1645991 [Trichonephila clavipes]|nr:hypothetical protein TNCV_1645991 [Trichonephila clavipes]